ncbi:MAG: sulfatase-like hydrolase/transferase [Planctomycetota bacterium]|nr:sulfatase-like hydrolase/transferase [Planctomycetota bacterium]
MMRLFILLIMGLLNAAAVMAAERSNVLVLIADDLRPDAIGANGNPDVKTPNIDLLMQRGRSYDRAYCMGSNSGAVCAPSRAMLLTGRSRFVIPQDVLVPWGPATGTPAPPMLPEIFRAQGWRTFATGKWHQRRPHFSRCFDDGDAIFFGGMGPHEGLKVYAFDPEGEYPKDDHVAMTAFSSTGFADAAITFLHENANSTDPFFAWVAFTAPHDPRTPPSGIRSGYDDSSLTLPANVLPEHPFDNGEMTIRDEKLEAWPRTPEALRRHLGDYYGMIEQMDAQIGRILESLEASGQADNTIVVFLADHGLGMGSHGLLGKQNLYEHSAGAPLVVAGPGIKPAQRRSNLVYLHDVVPWLLDQADLEHPSGLHARNLETGAREALVLHYRDGQRALVEDRWKLIVYPQAGLVQLFDLKNDPYEQRNLASEAPERVERMRQDLVSGMREVGDQLELPSELLPAPDAS